MKIAVTMKDVYAEQTSHLKQGPRNKSEATFDLEKIVLAFLNTSDHEIAIFYNARQELEVKIDDSTYNLAKILEYADFEHLEFEGGKLDNYVLFLQEKTTKNQPHLDNDSPDNELGEQVLFLELPEKNSEKEGDGFPSVKDFADRDTTGIYDDLSYAEKLAVNVYSTSAYRSINTFLRVNGGNDQWV